YRYIPLREPRISRAFDNGRFEDYLVNPDSSDDSAFPCLRKPIPPVISSPYDGSSSRILTDPTGERRSRRFRQHFRGLRSCQPNPSGESGMKSASTELRFKPEFKRRIKEAANASG